MSAAGHSFALASAPLADASPGQQASRIDAPRKQPGWCVQQAGFCPGAALPPLPEKFDGKLSESTRLKQILRNQNPFDGSLNTAHLALHRACLRDSRCDSYM